MLLPDGLLPAAPAPVVLAPVLCCVPAVPDEDGAPDIALFSLTWPVLASLQWVAGDTSAEDGDDADWADADNAPPAKTADASRMVPIFMLDAPCFESPRANARSRRKFALP